MQHETWTPSLRVDETPLGCRLALEGVAYGHGHTLQEAGDDLIVRLLNIANTVRASHFGFGRRLRGMDRDMLDFLREIGEMSARGEDVRELVF